MRQNTGFPSIPTIPAIPVVIVVMLAVLFWQTFNWLFSAWFDNEYYSHGILLPLVSLFFLWRERAILLKPRPPSGWGLALIGIGIGIHLGAVLWSAYFISALALIVVLFGLVVACYGAAGVQHLGFPVAFLLLAIPLPVVPLVAGLMQVLTAETSTSMVQMVGVPATNLGGRVDLPTCSLVVGAACSGMNSLITLVTLATLFIYVMQTSLRAMIVLSFLVVPLALAGNIIRVTSLLLVANNWGLDAGLRYYHDISGWVFYAVVLLLLGSVAWGLGCRELRFDMQSSS